MIIQAGSRLGPYEILEPLGAGGMGEVWKARDTRLDRLVAIKFIPASLAADAEMRQRLEREARAVAALSHPNICVLHDVGSMDGTEFLVMELLDGETLSDRIARAPLPLDLVYRTGIQIAAALDKAHRQGIVHRDLKPGNVMLTRSGAKLLDFGLAKLSVPIVTGPVAGRSPTPAGSGGDITQRGMVVGTVQYMAPETLEGREADARSDLFSLGAVLYEMATGRKAFQARSHAGLISAVLTIDPPPVASLRPGVPAGLERLIRTCLAKDPEERWQSAFDVKRELEWLAQEGESEQTAAFPRAQAARPARPIGRMLLAGAAGALIGAAAFALAWRSPAPRGAGGEIRFAVDLPEGDSVGTLMRSALAFAPDGRRLAFAGVRGTGRHVFFRDLSSLETRLVAGTDRAEAPFFSPDGAWLGFFADGKLRKLSIDAEVASVVCDAPEARGGTWGEDGTILFAPAPGSGLMRVPASGGKPEPLTTPDAAAGENSHRWPVFLPDAKAALFTIRTDRIESFDDAKIAAIDLSTRRVVTLVDGGTYPLFIPPSTLLYARGGVVYAAPFDPGALKLTGPARKLLEGVSTNPTAGGVAVAVSRAGALAWVAGSTEVPKVSIRWVSAEGEEPPLAEFRRRVAAGALSPDRTRLALRIAAANDDLWTYDLERGNLVRLTSEPGDEVAPIWTRDGRAITFAAGGPGKRALFSVAADGSSPPVKLHSGQDEELPACWTPDGRTLLYERPKTGGGGDVASLTPEDGAVRPVLASGFRERMPAISPDGKRIAYVSNESGRDEVFVQPFPGPGARTTISTKGGDRPLWLPNGDLTFRSEGKRLAVTLGRDAARSVSPPRVLFDDLYLELYGVSADGKRFLVLKGDEPFIPATGILVSLPASAR